MFLKLKIVILVVLISGCGQESTEIKPPSTAASAINIDVSKMKPMPGATPFKKEEIEVPKNK